MTKRIRVGIFAVALAVAFRIHAQQLAASKRVIPLASEDGECKGKTTIPKDVLAAVLRTPIAKTSLEENPSKEPATLFRASLVRLGQAKSPALLVCGLGQMTGADNEWYWIVMSPYNQPRVVLFEGTDGLSLLPRFHHGYRDILSGWFVAAQSHDKVFHFDGTRYTLASERCYVPIPGNNSERRVVPCP